MLKIDINQTFNQIVKLLVRLGIWREWEGPSSRRMVIKLCGVLMFLLFLMFIMACAWVSDDKNEAIFLWLAVFMVGVIAIKLVYLMWKKDEILTFLHEASGHRDELNDEHARRANFFFKFVNGYICMLIFAVIFYNTSCLPWVTRDRRLPFFIRFTWNGRHSEIIYWMSYAFVGTGIFYCNVCILIAPIVWHVMLSFAAKYDILGDKLRGLGNGQLSSSGNKKFLKDLIGLVKAHRNLFKAIDQFRSCFFILFASHITTSGTSICVSMYNLAFNSQNNFFQMAIYIAVMLYAFFDIFMVMYLGNEIKLASNRLSYCLFESDWPQQSTAVKKCVIIIGEILKQPHQLVIFIYPMDLKTLTLIIKGAYTLFNVLHD